LLQTYYIEDSIIHFGCNDSHTFTTPLSFGTKLSKNNSSSPGQEHDIDPFWYQSIIGILMYTMLGIWSNIAYAISCLSKYSANPSKIHLDQALYCLCYLASIKTFGLKYNGILNRDIFSLILGYSDFDWAGDINTCYFTGDYVFFMCRAAISWSSKL